MAAKTEQKTSDDKVTAARNKNLDLAIQQIAKDYGEGAIMRLGDEKIVDIDVIPTGNILIDRALGVGGFPRGRVVEVFGPESSGKTTLTLTVIAQAQKRGGLAAFIDVEHAFDPAYAKRLGVIWMICWFLNPVLAKKRCEFARHWCAPTPWMSLSSIPWQRSSPERSSRAR